MSNTDLKEILGRIDPEEIKNLRQKLDRQDEFAEDEQSVGWVCMPCFLMHPGNPGRLNVEGGVYGPVWCPWCGDKMDPAVEHLTDEELEGWHDGE